MDLKRKRGPSPGQNVATKKERWESELAAAPSECSPTASVSALISGVHSAQVYGGTFAIAGPGSTQTIVNNYHYGPAQANVLEILNSLSLPQFRDYQQDTLAKATEGTCLWLTAGDIFLFWIAKGKILWGIGIPGAGKTILASIVIRDLEWREAVCAENICVAYVYLRYSEPLSIRDILESLVKQIVERHIDLIPIIEGLYVKHSQERTRPAQHDLVGMLAEFVKHGKSLFFVLDALDEMWAVDRPVLLRLLSSLDVKLFITSRPLETLQQQFPLAQVFNIAASTSDLDLHIKDFLRNSPDVMALLGGTEFEERIVETIHRKSGGMFLHAKLQLESLRQCVSVQDMEQTLNTFPTDIEAIYTKTWERIVAQAPNHANLAKLILLWITHAYGEMEIEVLQRVVATSPETYAFEPKRLVPEAVLLSVCCGLVSLDEKTRLVRLMHYTTRDAILPRILGLFPVPHAVLAQVCIAHLTNCGFQHFKLEVENESQDDAFDALLRSDTLLDYAHRSWVHHVRQCNRSRSVLKAVATLVLNCTSFPLANSELLLDYGGPVHVAAFYGLKDLIVRAAALQPLDIRTTTYRRNVSAFTALMHAIDHGERECVQRLLRGPGRIDINAVDKNGWSALMHAAHEGSTDIVKHLLGARGIDIHLTSKRDGETALSRAIRQGHREIVDLLLAFSGT
ncbi:hypothetical protein BKA70DRAFT_1189984 [Coprinopsis sp. MPI-PUGE-AT-0042]|nr:hypothetical protein BKA70DRAFT_1189984 [Coprinopsis sp. MPI-PUGE-AT-0042]